MNKRTIQARDMIDAFNHSLQHISDSNPDAIQAIFTSVSAALMKAGIYQGFRYLSESEVPHGCMPGIRSDANPNETRMEVLFANTNSNRVKFL